MSEPRTVDSLLAEGYKLDIGESISRGWQVFSANMGPFIGYYLLFGVAVMVLSFIPFLGSLALAAVSGPLTMGLYIVAFKRIKGQSTEFGDFFLGFNYFVPLLLVSIVQGIFVTIGFVLLILPGIYLAVAYIFAMPLVVDRKLEFWDAMEASRKVVTKSWFNVFALLIILGVINFAGLLVLLVGLLFTGPFVFCCLAAAYDQIFGVESVEFKG